LIEYVARLAVDGEDIKLRGKSGGVRAIKGRIMEINLMKHMIVVAE